MKPNASVHRKDGIRSRGSAYILVLGASLLVAAIGVSSVMINRVRHKSVTTLGDMVKAQELARTAIERGLWEVDKNPLLWRTIFASGTLSNIPLDGGTFTLTATDPVDDNLIDNTTDPVILVGEGRMNKAKYLLHVRLEGDGSVTPGTWRRVVLN